MISREMYLIPKFETVHFFKFGHLSMIEFIIINLWNFETNLMYRTFDVIIPLLMGLSRRYLFLCIPNFYHENSTRTPSKNTCQFFTIKKCLLFYSINFNACIFVFKLYIDDIFILIFKWFQLLFSLSEWERKISGFFRVKVYFRWTWGLTKRNNPIWQCQNGEN